MEYCGVELTEEGLQHYGVKGMHWGVRRYQPYPGEADGRKLTRRQVRKTMRAIKRNSKRYAQRQFYADKSLTESLRKGQMAKNARAQGYTARAERYEKQSIKQANDTAEHIKGMLDYKKAMNDAVKKIESTGNYKVLADKGRTYLAGSGRATAIAAALSLPLSPGLAAGLAAGGMIGYRNASGRPINGKIDYKKPILRKTNGKKESGGFVNPETRVTAGQEKSQNKGPVVAVTRDEARKMGLNESTRITGKEEQEYWKALAREYDKKKKR